MNFKRTKDITKSLNVGDYRSADIEKELTNAKLDGFLFHGNKPADKYRAAWDFDWHDKWIRVYWYKDNTMEITIIDKPISFRDERKSWPKNGRYRYYQKINNIFNVIPILQQMQPCHFKTLWYNIDNAI